KVIDWIVAISSLLIILVLAYAGFGLVVSGGNQSAYEKAKGYFMNAIIGLIIILAAWTLIDTLMKVLVDDTKFGPWNEIDSSNCGGVRNLAYQHSDGQGNAAALPDAPEAPAECPANYQLTCGSSGCSCTLSIVIETPQLDGTCDNPDYVFQCPPGGGVGGSCYCAPPPPPAVPTSGCPDCIALPSGIPRKSRACDDSVNPNCQISASIASNLQLMHEVIGANGVNGQVTEAYPPTGYSPSDPTGIHSNPCHGNGTCVDYNFSGSTNSPENINIVIEAANDFGLRAVYEVELEAQRQTLINAGVPAGSIQTVAHITAPHFSIYKR
ncbi:hypothetical protein KC722_03210, partial [Candidatus Kaiserbacteria bacterium]|nr:hypothetical protein [Candidatus Kaiserbacteria bacterium]